MTGTKVWGPSRAGTASTVHISDGALCRAVLSDFGARLVALWVPDLHGTAADIVLGHDRPSDYETAASRYIGATCGRYANRIAGGRLVLDGAAVQLDRNEGENHLHGGTAGFDGRIWQTGPTGPSHATFSLQSPDGDMGYPGDLTASVTYAFTAPFTLEISMSAQVARRATVVNLVNHAYFNLAGQETGSVDGQLLRLDADSYLPVDSHLLPVSGPRPVTGTPFDFRTLRPIGADIPAGGFDHNFCLGPSLTPQILAVDPASGRSLSVWTDQPGVQLYTADHLPQGLPGKTGARLGPRSGFTLETQCWPDSPNRPDFPNARLIPGHTYRNRMVLDLTPGVGLWPGTHAGPLNTTPGAGKGR